MRTVKLTLREEIPFERGMRIFAFYRMCFPDTTVDGSGRIVVNMTDRTESVYFDQLNLCFGVFVFSDISDNLGEPEPADIGSGERGPAANASDGTPPEV